MNEQSQYLLRSIRGPVTIITVGVLFTIDRFTQYHFSQTWPVLLIVLGLLQLLCGSRRGTVPPAPQRPGQDGPG